MQKIGKDAGMLDLTGALSLSEICASLDSGMVNHVPFNSNDKLRINCYLFPKYCTTPEDIKNNSIRLVYRKDITKLVIDDDVSTFGYTGYMDVLDNNGSLRFIFSQHYNLILSINISSIIGDAALPYEPYVCVVEKVTPTDTSQNKAKTYRLQFRDILSGLGDTISYSSIFAFYPEVKSAKTFEEAFSIIMRHLIEYTGVTFDEKIAYKKLFLFDNAGDDKGKAEPLYNAIASGLSPDDSFLEVLQMLLDGSVTGMEKLNEHISAINLATIEGTDSGSSGEGALPLLPLFCSEEYDDIQGLYHKKFCPDVSIEATNTPYIQRYISFRNFAMPFIMAFSEPGGSGQRYVYEVINPNGGPASASELEERTGFRTLMGQTMTPVKNVVHFPIDTDLVKKTWKNVHLHTDNQSGGESEILSFQWMFNYFVHGLLRIAQLDSKKDVVANYCPAFLSSFVSHYEDSRQKSFLGSLFKSNQKQGTKGTTTKEGDSSNSEGRVNHLIYNSNTHICKSRDIVAEKAYVVGKMMASLVLLNESYSIDINGSITRRPNEIIYFGRGKEKAAKNGEADGEAVSNEANMGVPTSFLNADHTLFYLKSVTHIFEGEDFTDRLFVNKVVESLT